MEILVYWENIVTRVWRRRARSSHLGRDVGTRTCHAPTGVVSELSEIAAKPSDVLNDRWRSPFAGRTAAGWLADLDSRNKPRPSLDNMLAVVVVVDAGVTGSRSGRLERSGKDRSWSAAATAFVTAERRVPHRLTPRVSHNNITFSFLSFLLFVFSLSDRPPTHRPLKRDPPFFRINCKSSLKRKTGLNFRRTCHLTSALSFSGLLQKYVFRNI